MAWSSDSPTRLSMPTYWALSTRAGLGSGDDIGLAQLSDGRFGARGLVGQLPGTPPRACRSEGEPLEVCPAEMLGPAGALVWQ